MFAQGNSEKLNRKSKGTIIPNVPNGVTYGVGIPVTGLGAVAIGATVSSKVFKRSIIDKIKYGITVQGVVDYFKKNTRFVNKQIDNKTIALLELDLGNNKKMFVHAYAEPSIVSGMTDDYKLIFADSIESLQVGDLKLPKDISQSSLQYDGTASYGECKNHFSNSLSFVDDYALGLCDLMRYDQSDLENSVFKGIDFSDDEVNYIKEAIEPHIKKLVSDLKNGNPDLQVVKFKKSEQPSN